jgi:glycosyltransferase involved in cell wall biosynthesis
MLRAGGRVCISPAMNATDQAAAQSPAIAPEHDVLCFSHLRWDFVFQRPQHLLSRFARDRRVFYFEEPHRGGPARIEIHRRGSRLKVVTPHVPAGLAGAEEEALLRQLVDRLIAVEQIERPIAWFYTPMALGFADHLGPAATIYDCMDELSGFVGAPAELTARERDLFARADLVFTGGESLYESKRPHHPRVYAFPSGIDRDHFARAREPLPDPPDQAAIPRLRLGFFGVIDERMDLDLVAGIADARPDWHLVMIGPVVKIDPASLPRRANIHWLGGRSYADLPAYIAGWDVAIMPFAHNASTRCISPTKTPEYLAAGKPVVSTAIRDVVHPYADRSLVAIADTPDMFVAAALRELMRCDHHWLRRVDDHLALCSWDDTWSRMHRLVAQTIADRTRARPVPRPKLAELAATACLELA